MISSCPTISETKNWPPYDGDDSLVSSLHIQISFYNQDIVCVVHFGTTYASIFQLTICVMVLKSICNPCLNTFHWTLKKMIVF